MAIWLEATTVKRANTGFTWNIGFFEGACSGVIYGEYEGCSAPIWPRGVATDRWQLEGLLLGTLGMRFVKDCSISCKLQNKTNYGSGLWSQTQNQPDSETY